MSIAQEEKALNVTVFLASALVIVWLITVYL